MRPQSHQTLVTQAMVDSLENVCEVHCTHHPGGLVAFLLTLSQCHGHVNYLEVVFQNQNTR